MFVIQISDVTKILNAYSCKADVEEIELLAYYQCQDKVCIVIKVVTTENNYVIKLLSFEPSDIDKEEKRNAFSEFLRFNNLPVPKKYICDGNFCNVTRIENLRFLTTLEDYFGNDIKDITTSSAFMLGLMLGQIHSITYNSNYHLDYGCAFSALKSEKTQFSSIWRGFDICIFDDDEFQKLKELHNNKITELQELWKVLPISAVHGDLGLTSNFMYHKNGYGIIDFNLSGDEVLLGDLLITWYSSRYSYEFIREVPYKNIKEIKNSFFNGYNSARKMTDIEKHNFDKLSKIINGIYFNRLVADIVNNGNVELGKKLSKHIYESYFYDDTMLDLYEVFINNKDENK